MNTASAAPVKMVKTVVVDARAHMMGRLASVVAKQILNGSQVVLVRCEEMSVSGGLVRQKAKYERFLRKAMNTNPTRGPFHFRAPSRIFFRTLRGMVPHKTKRGAAALERLKCFDGVPAPYDKVKRMVVPDALQSLRLQTGHRFCKLGDLAASVGWNHSATLKELEAKRKIKSAAFYVAKKKLVALRAKAVAQVEAGKA
mmetsp:Transcript_4434/g.7362  ORF Transcript_4434/g.7362 Transcript_4434/m.7362 type:complete len:199 (+) Transcript_4434:1-597(+)|eukprot:CAMPEP_0119101698 /NCGR_PEP_ID=MMETSP1180-20130426/680_1 /TAXON_ID=3052 ORGANISM="Chlamydomonas cf sp, Strain CCMP681" /NCGR_SAMPLE_ID=MMETSP1180 /ASSEMBLY_ACC=CAM_ASM_000741 /LENGTH=198 /DNA_ID=CAMNT_0007085859 /DNA_START=1 /DNA_END=597 /DNA_ORIENTATION=+